jgi:hypothetical protein
MIEITQVSDPNTETDTEKEIEIYPVEPSYHPVHIIPRKIFDFLASAKLAMFLLIAILVSCLMGATVYRGEQAWNEIFATFWFNGLLVLLVVNVGCCFFGRIWGRRITLISLGMILFHLSFVMMFIGIVYNSLFYFRGSIRLTEGETLPNGTLESYDSTSRGRFFNISKLKGETSLIKMYTRYKVDGKDKRAAYQISVGEGLSKKEGIIYLTKNLEYRGYKYLPDKEGYSVLTILYDKSGKELYGAYLPLQSLRQNDKSYLYTTGSIKGPGIVPFPQAPEKPLFFLNAGYRPDPQKERAGEAMFQVWPFDQNGIKGSEMPIATGRAPVAAKADVGEFKLSAKEIRYWVAMNVRYEPGQPIVLASMWVGLFGIVLTTVARLYKKKQIASASTP